jgi:hypothetical protein
LVFPRSGPTPFLLDADSTPPPPPHKPLCAHPMWKRCGQHRRPRFALMSSQLLAGPSILGPPPSPCGPVRGTRWGYYPRPSRLVKGEFLGQVTPITAGATRDGRVRFGCGSIGTSLPPTPRLSSPGPIPSSGWGRRRRTPRACSRPTSTPHLFPDLPKIPRVARPCHAALGGSALPAERPRVDHHITYCQACTRGVDCGGGTR